MICSNMTLLGVSVYFRLLFLVLPLLLPNAQSGNLVETLPGFSGPLPFKMETGYVGVENVEFFYYFIESTGKPRIDPLLLYLNGAFCSGLNGLFFQAGPLAFNETDYSGGVPQLILTPYAWTKTASIIFLDSPVGAGFSYGTSTQAYQASDTSWSRRSFKFLRQWLIQHPEYITNRVFIATDSYSGLLAPVIAQNILDYNEEGGQPFINLVGIVSGSPHTDSPLQENSRIPHAHNMALISDKLYKAAKESCNGWYNTVDPSNTKCIGALTMINQCTEDINEKNILYPNCKQLSPKADEVSQRTLRETSKISHPYLKDWFCEYFGYLLVDIWANFEIVQEALHVRKGTVRQFYRCNITLEDVYDYTIPSAIAYQQNLTRTGLQLLLYVGDRDMIVPRISTEEWIKSLNLTVETSWEPWHVDGQVAGYKVEYSNAGYRLTYATIKGAGHSPTEYKRGNCFEMFERWIHFYPL